MIIFKVNVETLWKMNHILIAVMLYHLLTLEMIGEFCLMVHPK